MFIYLPISPFMKDNVKEYFPAAYADTILRHQPTYYQMESEEKIIIFCIDFYQLFYLIEAAEKRVKNQINGIMAYK